MTFEITGPALITDADGRIIRANQKLLEKTGYSIEEVIGKEPHLFKSELHDQQFYDKMWKELSKSGYWSGEIRLSTKEGRTLHPFWLTITAVKNEQQQTSHYISIYNF